MSNVFFNVQSTLKRAWNKYYDEYVQFLNSKSLDDAVEVVVDTIRAEFDAISYGLENADFQGSLRHVYIDEILQKDEFRELARQEARARAKRAKNKDNFKIAVEAITKAIQNIHKEIEYRKKGYRTYANPLLYYVVASLYSDKFANEKVSKKIGAGLDLTSFSEEWQMQKYLRQKKLFIAA